MKCHLNYYMIPTARTSLYAFLINFGQHLAVMLPYLHHISHTYLIVYISDVQHTVQSHINFELPKHNSWKLT